jgi:aminoglycoside phosphotransferase family enzyme/predicted kinase
MPHNESQQAVFALMGDPAAHRGAKVRRIDTHAAAVFLAGERAYKIKRAVKFPFLDYSSTEKRKAACEAELEVNRPFAPSIYRRIVAITRQADGQLALDGRGAPVEWAVEMRRFDEDATLDRLAGRGKIDAGLADAIARVVAKAHADAPVVAVRPWVGALARFLDQNDVAFRAMPGLFAADEAEALGARSRDALDRLRPLLIARGERGRVRRGHGDLHLGNIALIDGAAVPFDAIEFDPLIASGDVLYDLAFLLMDLAERGLPAAANVVFNRYLVQTRRDDDLDALAGLPLFLSLRAAIRAKVTAARLKDADAAHRPRIADAARAYFTFACRLIDPPKPVLVAIGGLSGTGKSVLARELAFGILPCPGALVLRSDVGRKAMYGMAETDPLPAEAYTAEATGRVYATLAEKARRAIAAGHSALVDAVFARPDERRNIAAAASGASFRGMFLTADLATRVARVGARSGDASDADVTIVRQQECYDVGALEWTEIDASGTPEDTLRHARATLAR